MEIAGQVIAANDPVLSHQLGVAVIYQRPALLPDLTVAENIAWGLEPQGAWRVVRWKARRERARELLARVGAKIAPDAVVRMLSMPEQQLVEIARALGADARVLILDEPTASLSEREVQRLLEVIRELRGQGVGIVYISHRLNELAQVADRVTVLRDGKSVTTRKMVEVTSAELIRLMVGREIEAVFPKRAAPVGETVLEVWNLGCRRSGVHGVNLEIRAGEIVGLAGLVGAGRTELARILFGLTPADEGEIFWRDKPVEIRNPERAMELGIGYVPEDRRQHGVILEMPVAANATLAVLKQVSSRGWIDFRRERKLAASYVKQLAVKTPSVDVPVGDLSGGNQQKVAIARWLATKPKLLDSGRADAGDRRGGEGGDSSIDGGTGGGRDGDLDDFVGATGDSGNERSDCGDAWRDGDRHVGPRGGDAGKGYGGGAGSCQNGCGVNAWALTTGNFCRGGVCSAIGAAGGGGAVVLSRHTVAQFVGQ